eukprot:scaffold559331_cov48-Prasinocladus_malaysianus.AAC.1
MSAARTPALGRKPVPKPSGRIPWLVRPLRGTLKAKQTWQKPLEPTLPSTEAQYPLSAAYAT